MSFVQYFSLKKSRKHLPEGSSLAPQGHLEGILKSCKEGCNVGESSETQRSSFKGPRKNRLGGDILYGCHWTILNSPFFYGVSMDFDSFGSGDLEIIHRNMRNAPYSKPYRSIFFTSKISRSAFPTWLHSSSLRRSSWGRWDSILSSVLGLAEDSGRCQGFNQQAIPPA